MEKIIAQISISKQELHSIMNFGSRSLIDKIHKDVTNALLEILEIRLINRDFGDFHFKQCPDEDKAELIIQVGAENDKDDKSKFAQFSDNELRVIHLGMLEHRFTATRLNDLADVNSSGIIIEDIYQEILTRKGVN